jgi:tetratricopeptide (TPR) repeat protein
MLDIHPPLAAYRADLDAARRSEIGPDDAEWLRVAIATQRAHAAQGASRSELLRALDVRLAGLLGESTRPSLDPVSEDLPTPLARIRALVERMEDSVAWNLATSTLHEGERLAESALERGRFWSQQARIARHRSDFDTAIFLYERAEQEGRREKLPELRARAWIGFAALSQVRGNYPELERCAQEALRLMAGEETLGPLASLAHHFLLVRAGARGDLAGAILHGWDAYRVGIGDPIREAERLLNVAQVLLDAGAPSAALSGFTAALQHAPPARLALPAWGGLAIAAARLHDRALVDHTSARIHSLTELPAPAYAAASALAEAARARIAVGLHADRWLERARSLALAQGFHEVVHAVEMAERDHTSQRDAAPAPASAFAFPAGAARIRDAVAELATRDEAYALA